MRRITRVVWWQTLALTALAVLASAAPAVAANKVVKRESPDVARAIDQHILTKIAAEKATTSLAADDAEFLRRLYLDIVGAIPPADKVTAFQNDKSSDKRAKIIDELLASPLYGRHMADIWQAMLLPRNSDNRRLQSEPMVKWLEENFNANQAWDKFATDLITSSGPQDKNGAVTFFLANQSADKVNDTLSRLFLGVRLECAQCHNHPFTKWKQADYWGMANFYTKVRADNVNRAAKTGATPGINESGQGRQRNLPESALNVAPKFLMGEQPKLQSSQPYRPTLAAWLTAGENPYFARAMVNRIWHQFFGRGIVSPVDDMHEGNTPTHPELLQELSAQFVASGFDVKHLIRSICNSQTYQRSSKPVSAESNPALFAHMSVKVMTPEQLYDSLEQVLGKSARPERPAVKPAGGRQQPGGRAQFVNFFLGDENADPTDYQDGIPQALRLMNSSQMNSLQTIVGNASKGGMEPAQVIDRLYLTTVSRHATQAETERLTAYVKKQGSTDKALGDIVWSLLNSSEFRLNH